MLEGIKVNRYGLIGFGLIALMIVLHMLLVTVPPENSASGFIYRFIATFTSPYVLLALIPYIAASFFINRRLDSQRYTKRHLSIAEQWRYQNLFIGCQIALVLLIIGLFLGLNQILWYIIYFVVAVAIGLLIPFLIFSKPDLKKADQNELEF